MAQEKKIVKLSVVRNKRLKQSQLAVKQKLVQSAKEYPQDMDGWAIIAFKRVPDDTGIGLDTVVDYFVVDPMDLSNLPQLAQMVLFQRIFK